MMLKSASTPSLRSPVVSFSPESPRTPSGQLSCNNRAGFPKSLVNSPCSAAEVIGAASEILRRVRSAGNLEECFNLDDFPTLSRQSSRRLSRMPTLEAIPSFYPGEEEEEEEEEDGELAADLNFNPLNLGGICDLGFPSEGKMYLAAGIGANAFGAGCGGGDWRGGNGGGGGMETHYRKMVVQNPKNPLFLRNYAHFLYQIKGDLVRAEEYYSLAILADPEDGEIICEYANLIWELHKDGERARSYFERAIKADSKHSSEISASYASFLWAHEEEEEEEDKAATVPAPRVPFFHHGMMASATV